MKKDNKHHLACVVTFFVIILLAWVIDSKAQPKRSWHHSCFTSVESLTNWLGNLTESQLDRVKVFTVGKDIQDSLTIDTPHCIIYPSF